MDTIHDLIQFSLAPVFLLTAISAILGVLSNRLIRIVDRSREIDKLVATTPEAVDANLRLERLLLRQRSRLTNWAISLCVTSIFLVSLAIVVLFASAYVEQLPVLWIALIFACALFALMVGLAMFLREVYLATANLRIGS
jgi:hypothetical protein